MQKELTSIAQILDVLIQNPDERLYISGQHAFDESLIFGTTDAYLRLALELIKFIGATQCGEAHATETDGIKIQTSGSISNVFESCSEVILDNSDLVQTEADARKLFEYFHDQQAQSFSICHMADYSKQKFQDCDFTDAEITNCKTAGLRINGIALEALLDCYRDNGQ